MKIFMFLLKLMVPILFYVCFAVCVSAQTTAFNYQGSLKDGASAANGNYDFQFALYDAVSGGNQLGSTLNRNSLAVANGVFTVSLDFGSQFPGANRFLEIRVRLTGQPSLTTLTPRQQVNSEPYSVKSLTTDTASSLNCTACVTAAQIASVNGASITGTIPAASIPAGSGSYIQNGTGLQTANQNISGNGFFGGQVAIGTTVPSSNVKLQVNAGNNFGIQATSTNNDAVSGVSTGGRGLYGSSTTNDAIVGFTDGNSTSGVVGVSNSTGTSAKGVSGSSTAGTGVVGGSNSGRGVWGNSVSGTGVFGQSTSGLAGDFAGRVNISGQVAIGNTSIGSSQMKVQGAGSTDAIFGLSTSGIGVTGSSDSGYGVTGSSLNGTGTRGISEVGTGVEGTSTSGIAVSGITNGNFGVPAVRGFGNGQAYGVWGESVDGIGVYGKSTGAIAGLFDGRVNVSGNLAVGISLGFPNDKLTVLTATTNYGLVHTDGTISVGSFVGGTNGGGWYGTRSNHPLSLFAGGSGAVLNVTTAGRVGIGTLAPAEKLTVQTATGNYGLTHTDGTVTVGSFVGGSTGGGWFGTKSNHPLSFFTNNGTPSISIDTSGLVYLPIMATQGGAPLCRNGPAVAFCSSSLRYKTNIAHFLEGMSFVNKLQPISYDWKKDGEKDIGFGAEDIEKIDPRFVTYNNEGQVEGVKYDRIGVVLVNAVKEQQAQIEELKKSNINYKTQIDQQNRIIDSLIIAMCSTNPNVTVCKEKGN